MEAHRSESENDMQVTECPDGRKSRSKVKLPKNSRNKRKIPNIACTHGLPDVPVNTKAKGRKECRAADLTYDDITTFHHHVNSLNKIDQDKLLLKYMEITSPKRRSSKKEAKKKNTVSVKYRIRNKGGQILPVCAATFQAISGMSKDRLSHLACRYHVSGKIPVENRGGDRTTAKDKEVTEAIKNDIKMYKCRESHYSRNKSRRGYLPSELSINKMWQNFCKKRKTVGSSTCSLSKYKRIFYDCFNLSFKTPHTDTCSTCKIGLLKIKKENNVEKKNQLRTYHRLHKLRAKRFYSLMKEEHPNVIKVCFDIQQNQPIPKITVGEAFYSRQVWFYNLCVMVHSREQTKENIAFYTWLETEGPKGCNEVASGVLDFLRNLETSQLENGPTEIHLFSDSCSSQNKNTIMMSTLMAFMEESRRFSKLVHYFPIRGHSYMPPDRVFGRVEKAYRKKEEILSPAEYYEVLGRHGTIKTLDKDWEVKDLKSSAIKALRSKMPFKITTQRVMVYEKSENKVLLSVSDTYSGSPVEVQVLKSRNCSQEVKKAGTLQKRNMVSKEKKKDVLKLMKHFEIPEGAEEFYKDIVESHH